MSVKGAGGGVTRGRLIMGFKEVHVIQLVMYIIIYEKNNFSRVRVRDRLIDR